MCFCNSEYLTGFQQRVTTSCRYSRTRYRSFKRWVFRRPHDGVGKYIFERKKMARELHSDEIDELVVTNEFDKPLEGHVERVDVILDYLVRKKLFYQQIVAL